MSGIAPQGTIHGAPAADRSRDQAGSQREQQTAKTLTAERHHNHRCAGNPRDQTLGLPDIDPLIGGLPTPKVFPALVGSDSVVR